MRFPTWLPHLATGTHSIPATRADHADGGEPTDNKEPGKEKERSHHDLPLPQRSSGQILPRFQRAEADSAERGAGARAEENVPRAPTSRAGCINRTPWKDRWTAMPVPGESLMQYCARRRWRSWCRSANRCFRAAVTTVTVIANSTARWRTRWPPATKWTESPCRPS